VPTSDLSGVGNPTQTRSQPSFRVPRTSNLGARLCRRTKSVSIAEGKIKSATPTIKLDERKPIVSATPTETARLIQKPIVEYAFEIRNSVWQLVQWNGTPKRTTFLYSSSAPQMGQLGRGPCKRLRFKVNRFLQAQCERTQVKISQNQMSGNPCQELRPTSSLEPKPICLQLLIAWNSAVRTPRCKVGEVRHQWGCAVGRFHEYGGFVGICEKHFINGVLRTVSLLDDPEDSSFSRS
jgi:hypothetical protein